MKKQLIILSTLLYSGFAFSQIGVNTPDAQATFDITAKEAKGISRTAEGLLIPRVDRERARSMDGVATSTLIYINDAATSSQDGTAVNIDAEGYYYFDGISWVKLNPLTAGISNIYNSDGMLTADRTVSQGDKTLRFTGTSTDAFSVDGTTFSVDAANHRVGIGTAAPNHKLDLGSSAGTDENDDTGKKLAVYNNAGGTSFYGLGVHSGRLQFHASSRKGAAPSMALTNTGNLGIGTTDPSPNAILELNATNKGFLPPRLTTAQRNAIPAATRPAGLMIYNTNTNCMDFWNSSEWVSTCAVATPPAGTIATIDCSGATHNGTITTGTNNSVTSVISYTGGNGGSHSGQTVNSTGVTGLTATLTAGSFVTGTGTLTYTITGTPSATGTATFAINIGGRTCNLSRTVTLPVGSIASLNCAGATNNGTLTGRVAASGVSSVISYTGGNGGTYTAQSVASTGVTGLTATLTAGNFANGAGTITYTITGTPAASGIASFAINIGGRTCTLTRTVAGAATPPPASGANCTSNSFLIPYTANGGTANGTINGIPVTATITSTGFTAGAGITNCFGATQATTFRGAASGTNTLTIRFNKAVSNAKVYDIFTGASGSIIRYYNNGVQVTPTGATQSGNCGGYVTAARPAGGVWYNEIRISTTSANIEMICVSDVQ